MSGRMVVLKPVAWSPNGYRFPAGIEKKGTDFVAQKGFGHEEWNGDPARVWKGQRVFHTEVKGRMEDYGRRGDLGIIMTAYSADGPHAVGVATSVRLNTEAERKTIARSLGTASHATEMWKLRSIQERHPDFSRFEAFWREKQCEWISWRCPLNQYEWFRNPIRLDPAKLFPPAAQGGKVPDIIKMFSSYMAISPDQAIAVIWNSVSRESQIIDWLTSGTFDDVAKRTRSYGPPTPSDGPRNHRSAPPATSSYQRYVQAREITVTPRHSRLQNRFKTFIEANGGTDVEEDQAGIDIQFMLNKAGYVLAEVKPCDVSDARFAVRTAMGQLLDYRQRQLVQQPRLLMVLEVEPSSEDARLATSNGFGIAYPRGQNFALEWTHQRAG